MRRHPVLLSRLQVWDLASALASAEQGGTADAGTAGPPTKKARKHTVSSAMATGLPVAMHASAATAAHDKDINSIAVSPNDALVATGACENLVHRTYLPSPVILQHYGMPP